MENLYETREVVLSRAYPFGDKKKAKVRGKVKEVSVLKVHELNGYDDEQLLKVGTPTVYDEIAISCGLTVEDAKSLSRADARLVQEVLNDFLYASVEVELID
jgi:hypothetical protein